MPADSADPTRPSSASAPEVVADSYVDFLVQQRVDSGADFDRFCGERPALAQALRRLHDRFRAGVAEASAPISLAFSEKLLGRYGPWTDSGAQGSAAPAGGPSATGTATGALSASEPRYQVGEEVARGGMGAILRVWDRSLERTLAMKVMLAERRASGENSPLLQRFLREARITGRLDHPGVVPVYEIGVDATQGVFFTMRLVAGRDLRQIFDLVRRRVDGWTRRRALEVVLKVCDTMAYCHEQGVVHRDLKPANIMVGSFGEVYVMDWGLARLADESCPNVSTDDGAQSALAMDGPDASLTHAGLVLGTPAYMPPEQALGLNELVGPRADVYSVGAMLYALLAGCAPYRDGEAPPAEVIAAVRVGPPTAIAVLDPQAPAGLVAICERAMARDLEQRYGSMASMADALREYLESEQQAAREAERARAEAENAQRVASFLASIFSVSHPEEARGASVSAREIIDRGAERIDQDLADQPIVQATLRHTLGEIYRNLGLVEPASRMLEAALAMREAGPCADPVEAARTLTALASVRAQQARSGESLPLFRRALELRRSVLGNEHPAIAASASDLAAALWESGDYRAAEPVIRDAVDLMRRLGLGKTREMAPVLLNMALVLFAQQRWSEAVPCYREALEIFREQAPDSIEAASCANNFGDCYFAMGDYAGAWELHQESQRLRQNLYDARHPATAMGYQNQGTTLVAWGDAARAIPLLELALDIRRERFGSEHPSVATCYANLATCARDQGRLTDAEALHREALRIREASLGPESPVVASSLAGLAAILVAVGRLEEAESLYERSLRIRRQKIGDDYFGNWTNELGLATIAHARGQLAVARASAQRVIDAYERHLPRHPNAASARHLLATILADLGDLEAAATQAREAAAIRRERLLPTHPARAESEQLWLRLEDAGRDGAGPRTTHPPNETENPC
ncbi:MAG: tetratricopeptide repeat protein [Planctomycetota bacterium]